MPDLSTLYRNRFEEARQDEKNTMWRAICDAYMQDAIGHDKVVLDLASGYGEFSRNIEASKKIAIDLNPDAGSYLDPDVEFHNVAADTFTASTGEGVADVVFTSNFLEHLPNKTVCDAVLAEVLKVLRPGGRFVIMGPNIRYLASEYWDFYDHYLPLSHLSLEEGLQQSGFEIEKVIPRFLPYTTKSALPTHPFLIKAYLKMPIFWPLLGKQFLVTARKPAFER